MSAPHSRHQELRTRIAGAERRAGIAERRTTTPKRREVWPREVVFSFPGDLTVVETGRYYHPTGGKIANIVGALPAGTTDSTIVVKKNGTTILTFTWTSGKTTDVPATNTYMEPDTDYLTVAVTTVGTAAADATIAVRFS